MKTLLFHPAGLLFLCALVLGGCAVPVTMDTHDLQPAEWTRIEPDPERPLFKIDRESSRLLVRVDPAGPMARLGHSHVIGTSALQGFIQPGTPLEQTRAAIVIELADLEVDRPEWRSAWALEPEMDPEAIQGTRANLLGERVLNAAEFPRLEAGVTGASGFNWQPVVDLRIRLRGNVRALRLPVALFADEHRIEAVGEFAFRHADFGLEPFTVAGGALSVAETIQVRFRIVARPAESGPGEVAIIADQPTEAPRTNQ